MKLTIKDAPACLNTSDKAMWLLGYNEAIEKLNSAEPVGYFDQEYSGGHVLIYQVNYSHKDREGVFPLFTHPPAPSAEEVFNQSESDQTLHACISFVIHGDADFYGMDVGLVDYFKKAVIAAWEKQSLLEYSEIAQERDAFESDISTIAQHNIELMQERDALRDALETFIKQYPHMTKGYLEGVLRETMRIERFCEDMLEEE